MNDRILSLFGLCRRARRLTIGADRVCGEIREGTVYFIGAASDFSHNSIKAVERTAQEYGVTLTRLPYTKDELSWAVGKPCGVLCITDKGFAGKLRTLLAHNSDSTNTDQGGTTHGYDD